MPRSRIILIGSILFVITLFGAAIFFFRKPPPPEEQAIPLTVWGVLDPLEAMKSLLAEIPGFVIDYRRFDLQNYESTLINALAAGKGPDVFMAHSSWIPEHYEKMSPIPAGELGISSVRDIYPTVVEQDFAPDGLIYALPLYIDTLALLYNQNIFDRAGIALPPKTWSEFQNIIPKLRELDQSGKILKAAAAIGGSNKNINRATDLLSAVMLQSGAQMVAPDFEKASFAQTGLKPLLFYTSFANPGKDYYTWNQTQKNSLDSFAEENTAMIFNYAYQIPAIKEKNPFLPVGIAPLPQPTTSEITVNYANYWGLAVSNRTADPIGAWKFIHALTVNPEGARAYAERTNHLPALRSLIQERLSDPFWGVFAKQALSARSWPEIDSSAIDVIFSKLIEAVLTGIDPGKALDEAESAVTELMQDKKSSRL